MQMQHLRGTEALGKLSLIGRQAMGEIGPQGGQTDEVLGNQYTARIEPMPSRVLRKVPVDLPVFEARMDFGRSLKSSYFPLGWRAR